MEFAIVIERCSLRNRSTQLDGELTSVQISNDSQYALVNHSPNVSSFDTLSIVLFNHFSHRKYISGISRWPELFEDTLA